MSSERRRFERSKCLLFDIKPLGQLPLLVSMLSLVYRCDRPLLLHDLSTLRIDLWPKGDPLHRHPQLFLYSLLNAPLLFLLPLRHGAQKFIAKVVLLACLLYVHLLELLCDGEVCLVFLQAGPFEWIFPKGALLLWLGLQPRKLWIFSLLTLSPPETANRPR